jgi:2-polyprenyl-3-methyl-5-hydroxy-6-metoxy-1,4-benzoquinol methylase
MKTKQLKDKKGLIEELINNNDIVLDVGFWGQGVSVESKNWVHRLIKNTKASVYGVDLEYDSKQLANKENYQKTSAEDFSFDVKFSKIIAADIIEHLSNPGLFLNCSATHLTDDGELIITTPNCFNLFNLAMKLTRFEPVVNSDHTFYFNYKTLSKLLEKNGFAVKEVGYLYTSGVEHKESIRKKFLNVIYYILSKFTPKFYETLYIVAVPLK